MNDNQGNKFFTNLPSVVPNNNQNNTLQQGLPSIQAQNNNINPPQNNQNQFPQTTSNIQNISSSNNQNNNFSFLHNNQNQNQNQSNTSPMNLNLPDQSIDIRPSETSSKLKNDMSFGFDFLPKEELKEDSTSNKKKVFSSLFKSQNSDQIAIKDTKSYSSVVDEIVNDASKQTNFKNISNNTIGNTNSELLNNSINILPINQMNDTPPSLGQDEKSMNSTLNVPFGTLSTTAPSPQNITDFHRRNLLMEFVGYKYEKISQNPLNIFALIFGEFYVLYRRMIVIGMLLLALRISLIIYVNPYLSLIINIVLFLTFNKTYLLIAKGKIRSAERKNRNATYEQLKNTVVASGQTKMSNPITAVFVTLIIGLIYLIATNLNSFSFGPFKDFNILVLLGKNPEFKGDLTYDNSTNINNYYEIVMPEEIKSPESSQGSIIGGIKTDPNDNFSNCHYSFNVLKDYSNAKNLAKQMKNYYKLKNNPEELQINSITWYHISYENNGTVNLYLTSRNKKVYMYEFREEKNANTASCEQYNTSILNSIYYK